MTQRIPLQTLHSFALPAHAAEVRVIDSAATLQELSWQPGDLILGAGTNTLFTCDYPGRILLNRITGRQITAQQHGWSVSVGAGEDWHQLVVDLVTAGIPGFENLALIPGSIGAAPVQNIGAYGVEVEQFVKGVEGVHLRSGDAFHYTREDCQFGYRHSVFKGAAYRDCMITRVHFWLPRQWQAQLDYPDLAGLPKQASPQQIMAEVMRVRQRKLPDPVRLPNAGSFFKNPVVDARHLAELLQTHSQLPYFELGDGRYKIAAGWLIDQLGFKGFQLGGAAVHERQALVLVNRHGATGADVVALARLLHQEVKAHYDIALEPEVGLIGETL